ncbi:MAG: HPr family phosphocarrier protein [Chlorobium sp.]|jgi:phosphotransferase system HPr (HPr) family protein|nr:HPr family phosphocarrier protein [Chlorobium sp.]
MVNKHLTVKKAEGLHFRALAKILQITLEQQCSVVFQKINGEKANANSLHEMLSLCCIAGTLLQVTVDGKNENKTLSMIEEVFENGAGI